MTPDGSQASFSNDTQEDDGFTFRRARPRRESSSTLNLKRKAIEEFEDFQHPSAPSPKRAHYSQRPSIRQSVASLTSDASVKLSDELPHNVPADKLYTALAPELPESERLRQILIWSAKSSLEKSAFARKVYKNQDERIAKEIAYRIKEKIVEKLVDKSINVSLLSYPQQSKNTAIFSARRPHQKNIQNLQRLKQLSALFDTLKNEEEEWKNSTNRIFEEHAEVMDRHLLKEKEKVELTEDKMLEGLDEQEKKFYERYLKGTGANSKEITDAARNLEKNITNLRHNFNVTEQLVEQAKEYLGTVNEKFTEKQRIQEKDSVDDALRLITRL